MTGSSVVVGGEWKDVASELVVVNGEWTPILSNLTVVNGAWKTGYTAGAIPKISVFNVVVAPSTPWAVVWVDWDVDNFLERDTSLDVTDYHVHIPSGSGNSVQIATTVGTAWTAIKTDDSVVTGTTSADPWVFEEEGYWKDIRTDDDTRILIPAKTNFDQTTFPNTGSAGGNWTLNRTEFDEVVITRIGSDGSVYTNINPNPLSSRIDIDLLQGVTYTYTLTYKRGGVDYTFSATAAGRIDVLQIKLQDIPAPVLSVSGITSKTAILNWPSTHRAEQYRIYRYNPSTGAYIGSWYMSSTSTSHSFANKLRAEYWYRYRISVKVAGKWSPLSNTVKFVTLSSAYKGRHFVNPTKSWTFLPRLKKTHYNSESLYHGKPSDNSKFRHTRHVTMIHYYNTSTPDPFGNIRLGIAEGLRIIKFEVWVQRRHAGPNRGVNLWVSTHRSKTKPRNLGNIRFNSNNTKIGDRVGEGWRRGEWVNLPTSLGYAVIKSVGKGIAMGRTNEPWKYWANFPRNSSTPVGKLKIVLG